MKSVILKFGGTSIGTAESVRLCANIIRSQAKKTPVIVVVSAVSGVTNTLIEAVDTALQKKPKLLSEHLQKLRERHRKILEDLLPSAQTETLWEKVFQPLFQKLCFVLQGISLVGEASPRTKAYVCSFGECLSSWILTLFLESKNVPAERISAERLIWTNSDYLDAEVNISKTTRACKRILAPILLKKVIPVVTGFIGRNNEGDITLLGRGGSDYTAGLLGLSLASGEVQIWTDVNGVMSADPRIVPEAISWPTIGLATISEMAHAGAKVLHPKSITPTVKAKIPVRIKNTFTPAHRGTIIQPEENPGLRGIASQKRMIIVHLTNPHMLGTFGFVRNCSDCFVQNGASIDTVTTSEISVSISLLSSDFSPHLELCLKKIADVTVQKHVGKVSIIGTRIAHDPDFLKKVFSALSGHTIHAVSIGASGHNITLLTDEKEITEIVQTLHNHLFSK